MTDEIKHFCAVCEKPSTLRCSQCKIVYYCSAEHIRSDWSEHKAVCKTAKPTKGETMTVSAVLFPVKGSQPQLVDVKYTIKHDEDTKLDVHFPDLSQWIPKVDMSVRPITSYGMFGQGKPLGRTLLMFFNDNYLNDGSPVNESVQAVTNGQATKWGGNILVLRGREPLYKYTQYYNATMDDVEPMVAFFKDYNAKSLGYESEEAGSKLSIQMF